MATPAKFGDSTSSGLGAFANNVSNLTNILNPFSQAAKQAGQVPFYSTGARSLIKIGGRAIGVSQNVHWVINYQAVPVFTIDTVQAWDIDVSQLSVTASLEKIIDPTAGPESENLLLGIMSSAVHAPLVELQILDALGTSLFFARGMFTGISGSVSRGQASTLAAQFTGIAYQNYVSQGFAPYTGIASGMANLVNGLGGLASSASGGIL